MPDRIWKALAVVGVGMTLSGCYSCSLNGGWERQMNPFCAESRALVGGAPSPMPMASLPPTQAR